MRLPIGMPQFNWATDPAPPAPRIRYGGLDAAGLLREVLSAVPAPR